MQYRRLLEISSEDADAWVAALARANYLLLRVHAYTRLDKGVLREEADRMREEAREIIWSLRKQLIQAGGRDNNTR